MSVAANCGPQEISEALLELKQLECERSKLPEWDGDSSDDILRAQKTFSKVLSGVPIQHLPLVAEGLKSESVAVRFYTALAFKDRRAAVAKPWLQAAFTVEQSDLNRRILQEAIQACSNYQKLLIKLGIFKR